jgi:glutathione S-transferase
VVKLYYYYYYYYYSRGAGNGALPEGRTVSSFLVEPHWSKRPWPPREEWRYAATDVELGSA